MSKLKVATVWLDGCSGCHMSFLDMDERLLELAELVDVVYSPIVDAKDFPDEVDIALVEGAVASVDDEAKIKKVRAHSEDADRDGRLRRRRQRALDAQSHRPREAFSTGRTSRTPARSSRFPAWWCPSCSRSCAPSTNS